MFCATRLSFILSCLACLCFTAPAGAYNTTDNSNAGSYAGDYSRLKGEAGGPSLFPGMGFAQYNGSSLDTSVLNDGRGYIKLGTRRAAATASSRDAQGRTVMAGAAGGAGPFSSDADFALVRAYATGELDSGFGTGSVQTDFSAGKDVAKTVAIQPDGKIVAAGFAYGGSTTRNDMALARYLSNGDLDTSFATNGKKMLAFSGTSDEGINSMVILPDGKILIAGWLKKTGSNNYLILARFNADGSTDTTFDSDGIVETGIQAGYSDPAPSSMQIQTDGKIVVGTSTSSISTYNFLVARFSSSGALDTSFGIGGRAEVDLGSSSELLYGIDIQPDGKILAVGYSRSSIGTYQSVNHLAAVRLTSLGGLDTFFGSGGKVKHLIYAGAYPVDATGTSIGFTETLDGDRIRIGGTANSDFLLASLQENGSLDTSFNLGGYVLTNFDTAPAQDTTQLDQPGTPAEQWPTSHTMTQPGPITFRWLPGLHTHEYDVYLDNVKINSATIEGDQNSYTSNSNVSAGVHTWKVVAKNNAGTATSATTTFRVTADIEQRFRPLLLFDTYQDLRKRGLNGHQVPPSSLPQDYGSLFIT